MIATCDAARLVLERATRHSRRYYRMTVNAHRRRVFTTDQAAALWARRVGRTISAGHIGKLCRTEKLKAHEVEIPRKRDGHPIIVWDIDRDDLARLIAAARAREKRAAGRA